MPELNPRKPKSESDVPAAPPKNSGYSDAFPGDPNFMTSLARGLAVIQAFSQRRHHLTISPESAPPPLVSHAPPFAAASIRSQNLASLDLTTTGTSFSAPGFWRSDIPTFPRCLWRPRPSRCLNTLAICFTNPAQSRRWMASRSSTLRAPTSPASCQSTWVSAAGCRHFALPWDAPFWPIFRPKNSNRFLLASSSSATPNAQSQIPPNSRKPCGKFAREGYSIIDQELEHGLRSMAVPIQNTSGKVVAALNIGAHAQRVSIQEMQTKFLPPLRAAAQELCLLLK